jgi:hypothetical protein
VAVVAVTEVAVGPVDLELEQQQPLYLKHATQLLSEAAAAVAVVVLQKVEVGLIHLS